MRKEVCTYLSRESKSAYVTHSVAKKETPCEKTGDAFYVVPGLLDSSDSEDSTDDEKKFEQPKQEVRSKTNFLWKKRR